MKIEDVPVGNISVGPRFRQNDGDIESLAANIRDMGLLQPVGVDADYRLIFGYRRFIACMDLLQWKTIPCAVLELESVLAGEYAENEFRKQFTASERVAISEALEKEVFLKRQGKRNPLSDAIPDQSVIWAADQARKALVQNIAQVEMPAGIFQRNPDGTKTRSLIAKAAGFGNPETMRQAQRVVDHGSPEVIAAMDSGEVSISAAAAIASQPEKDQAVIVAMPKDERREAVNRIRKAKAEQEASAQRARDLYLFRGLANAVELIAKFSEDPKETWAGLSRVSAFSFEGYLDRAIECLSKIRKVRPNEPARPESVRRSS